MYQPTPGDPLRLRAVLHQRVALAIRLVNHEGPHFDRHLAAALNSPPVLGALSEGLKTQMKLQLQPQFLRWGVQGPNLKQTAKNAYAELKPELRRQIEATPDYQALDASIKTLKEDLNKCDAGIWVDRNLGWAVLIGSAVGFGGVAGVYSLRHNPLVQKLKISTGELKLVNGGALYLGAKVSLKPFGQKLDLGLNQKLHLGPLHWETEIDCAMASSDLTKLDMTHLTQIDLARGLDFKMKVKSDIDDNTNLDFSLNGKLGKHLKGSASLNTDGFSQPNYHLALDYSKNRLDAFVGATFPGGKGFAGGFAATHWDVGLSFRLFKP